MSENLGKLGQAKNNGNNKIFQIIRVPYRLVLNLINEPHHEKTDFLHMQKQKGTDQLQGNGTADQYYCSRYLQPFLCWTWSETP